MCLVHHLQKGKGSKKRLKFTIDCSVLVDDDLLETGSFEKFMQDKIKVNGKAGNLGDAGEHTHTSDHTHARVLYARSGSAARRAVSLCFQVVERNTREASPQQKH